METESHRVLREALEWYQGSDQSSFDGRVRAIIITRLEEALLWESKLEKKTGV